ncbi:MAG: hypothetical protein H6855_05350 [Rhodospirillales bacterium]|nr:hypothetical protein [Rhodospirillales bacterium]MCB9979702.1 hypothetical protein [Rhodospirillales bacterium]
MKYQQGLMAGLGLLCLGLAGCSQDHPGNMSLKRVEVHQAQFTDEIGETELTADKISRIASHYERYGGTTPLSLTVQYDPTSPSNTAMNASQQAARIAGKLRKAGVQDVKTEILPVRDLGEEAHILVAYDEFSAVAPDCGQMPGMDNTKTDWKAVEEYGFGCSIETTISKQIARPRDLLGHEDGFSTDYDGRRVTNIIENHRSGVPNEPLNGQTASEE